MAEAAPTRSLEASHHMGDSQNTQDTESLIQVTVESYRESFGLQLEEGGQGRRRAFLGASHSPLITTPFVCKVLGNSVARGCCGHRHPRQVFPALEQAGNPNVEKPMVRSKPLKSRWRSQGSERELL